MAAQVATDIGGNGKVLDVHGISGVAIDTATFAGVKAVFAQCSGITTDDTIYDPVRRLDRQERRCRPTWRPTRRRSPR